MAANSKRVALFWHESFLEHRCLWDPKFPECPGRVAAITNLLKDVKLFERLDGILADEADRSDILRCHSENYVSLVESTAGMDEEQLKTLSDQYDSVYFHPETSRCAKIAVGAAVQLVEQIVKKENDCGIALVRPPGHHAMRESACGYSIFNNVAIAAKVAVDRLNLQRVMIVDWDVHHGQATQQAFYNDDRVLYFSIHRYEEGKFWPHLKESGSDHIGEGEGLGYNVNVPLNQTGATDADYLAIFHQLLLPMAHKFKPQLILVSCGFDASVHDPKGGMCLSQIMFGVMTHMLKGVCGSRLGLILEGGYRLPITAMCAGFVVKSLLNDPVDMIPDWALKDGIKRSTIDSILTTIYHLKPHWNCFPLQVVVDETSMRQCNGTRRSPRISQTSTSHPSLKSFDPSLLRSYDNSAETFPLESVLLQSRLFVDQVGKQTCLVYEETEMLKHHCLSDPDHVETPKRITNILDLLRKEGLLNICQSILGTRKATVEELALVHLQRHIEQMAETATTSNRDLVRLGKKFDSVYFSPGSYSAALTAVGCLLDVVDRVCQAENQNGLALVRPPGHHAEPDRPCGFCLFNNMAVAAAYALQYDYKRILILDWDVHHGNGIQSAFYDDPRVLYISLHRYDDGTFYPRETANNFTHVGEGEGKFYNLNIPFSHGAKGDGDYLAAFLHVVMPIAHQFNPELVLVSAGFDAAAGDPLGGYKLSPSAYAQMTHMLMGLAGGRVVLALEGGYNLTQIPKCVAACVRALLGQPLPPLTQSTANCSPAALKTILDVIDYWSTKWSAIAEFAVKLPPKPIAAEKLAESESDVDSFNLKSLGDSLGL